MRYVKILTIIFAISFIGCSDDDTPNPNKDCNCGTVANDGIDNDCYWLELRNNCSDNKKTFCVDQDKWMDAHPGTQFCITNSGSW
jgi:hypothetical protein